MQYEGQLTVHIKTIALNPQAFDIKIAAIQRELWKNFGAGAVLQVDIEKRSSEGEVLEAYQEIFKPGTDESVKTPKGF